MKPQGVNAIDIMASSCVPDVVDAKSPPADLLHAFVGPTGAVTTAILNSRIDMQLKAAPRSLGQPGQTDAAVGKFKARVSDDDVKFRVYYGCNAAWHIDHVDAADAWLRAGDGYREPDVSLSIAVSPAQEAHLWGENITGLTLTAPLPPATDWRLTFFGAQSAQPHVWAQCGYEGPTATLALDNSEIRWSDETTRQRFAFDSQLAPQHGERPAQPQRLAPAKPAAMTSRLKPPLAY